MANRDRIDWENLVPLPRQKRSGVTKEDLANRKFNIGRAKHKGRNHLSNQKRRKIARDKAKVTEVDNAMKLGRYRAIKSRVRSFWLGELDEHP